MVYLAVKKARALLESCEDWIFDLMGDMDIVTCLYSHQYLTQDNIYHFTHWMDHQFYCD